MPFISSRKTFLKAAAGGDVNELNYCIAYKIPASFSIDVKDVNNKTAACLAAENGQLDALKMLIDAKANLDIADKEGYAPLRAAVNAGKTAAARMLIAAGADVNTHDDDYVTPIIVAARNGQLDVVQDLVAAKADVNAVSKLTGRTALHWAIENGHRLVIEFLLAQNPRTDIPDRQGKLAADLAQEKDRSFIQNFLRAAPQPQAAAMPSASAPVEDSESWTLMGSSRVAHAGAYPALGRKITEIFNFESRERIIIAENLKTGAETMTQPEKFETLAEDTLARAAEQLKALGGCIPDKGAKKSFNL